MLDAENCAGYTFECIYFFKHIRMAHSFDRLIRLAKQTGDRLIIHDPIDGEDVVMMGIDAYEALALGGRERVREFSSDQLLDQINRDIAIWRSSKDMEDSWEEDFFGGADEDRDMPWHTPGEVLEDRYGWIDETDDAVDTAEDERILVEDIPFGPSDELSFDPSEPTEDFRVEEIPPAIPEGEMTWDEEPLPDEDPVFLEEPI